MANKKAILLVCSLLVFNALIAQIKPKMLLMDPQVQIESSSAVNHLYNFKFELAEQEFQKLRIKYPDHPLYYFLMGLNYYWRRVPNEDNTIYDATIIAYMDSTISLAEKMHEKNNGNPEATFFLAGAYGFQGRVYSDRKQWGKAIYTGRKAVHYMHENKDENDYSPEFLFGEGLYNYYAVWIPENYVLLKPILAFFPSGNKEKGLQQLKDVGNNAFYTRTEAQTYLMKIYANEENKINEAYPISKYLYETFPDNAFFHRFYARILYTKGFIIEAEKVCKDALRKIDEHYPGYEDVTGRYVSFYLGFIYKVYRKDYINAKVYLLKTIEYSEKVGATDMGYYLYAISYLAQIAKEEKDIPAADLYYKKIITNGVKDHETYDEAKEYFEEKKKSEKTSR